MVPGTRDRHKNVLLLGEGGAGRGGEGKESGSRGKEGRRKFCSGISVAEAKESRGSTSGGGGKGAEGRRSTLVAFRKRFSEEDLAAILEAAVPKVETERQDDSDDENDPPNSGTLVLDATCCPADIAYPQDINLLNQAREKAETTVDELCEATGQKRPLHTPEQQLHMHGIISGT